MQPRYKDMPLAESGACSFVAPGQPDSMNCGKPSTWHVMWDSAGENGSACDEHAALVRRSYIFFGMHAFVQGTCGEPGSFYDHDQDECYWPADTPPPVLKAAKELVMT